MSWKVYAFTHGWVERTQDGRPPAQPYTDSSPQTAIRLLILKPWAYSEPLICEDRTDHRWFCKTTLWSLECQCLDGWTLHDISPWLSNSSSNRGKDTFQKYHRGWWSEAKMSFPIVSWDNGSRRCLVVGKEIKYSFLLKHKSPPEDNSTVKIPLLRYLTHLFQTYLTL